MGKRKLSVLLYGEPKVGKTTTAMTAPGKKLLIDFENSCYNIDGFEDAYEWDPKLPPPEDDGTWSFCYVPMTYQTLGDLQLIIDWLKGNNHPFQSVILDSVSESQKAIKRNRSKGGSDMDWKVWGEIGTILGNFARDLRDIPTMRGSLVDYVIITAMEDIVYKEELEYNNSTGKSKKIKVPVGKKPLLSGSAGKELPYLFDIIAYMYVSQVVNPETGEQMEGRAFITEKGHNVEAGSRRKKSTGVFAELTIPSLIDLHYSK